MKKFIAISFTVLALLSFARGTQAKGDGFGDVVKLIEQFYHVKHQSVPLLARVGIKTATTIARVSGGQRKRIAEVGSARVVWFDDQDFRSGGNYRDFKTAVNAALAGGGWSPLIQVASARDGEQTYIYLRQAGAKFNVMVVTVEPREAYVVQANISPENLARLMQDPDEMGNAITVDATNDQ